MTFYSELGYKLNIHHRYRMDVDFSLFSINLLLQPLGGILLASRLGPRVRRSLAAKKVNLLKLKINELKEPFNQLEIEFADLNSCLYVHVVFTFNCIINCSKTRMIN